MKQKTLPQPRIWFLAPLLILVLGFLATLIVTTAALRISHAIDLERFDHAVMETTKAIGDRLTTYTAMLQAGAGFINAAGPRVDKRTFHTFVDSLDLDTAYRGVQGIGFSVRLLSENIESAQRELRSYGSGQIRIFPPHARAEYHAILFLEPMDRRNEAALGYDMFSEAVRRKAMETARDSGRPAASGLVELVQEIDEHKQAGFLIYTPVYADGAVPLTVPERRRRLLGFIYSPFRADDLMRGIFGDKARPRVHFDIFDGTASESTLLHRSPGPRSDTSEFLTDRKMVVAGREWLVKFTASPDFVRSSSQQFVAYILLGGLLATGLLTAVAGSQARARLQEIRAAFVAEERARELQLLHGASTQLSAELDPDRVMQAVVDAGRQICRAEIGAFFYNVTDPEGERFMLYSISGPPRETFAHLGMPRATQVFGPTFRGDHPIRSDDITADARYGKNPPHNGMPKGHWPVRSYLAVPVISRSGTVMGGLFYGHSQVARFTEEAEASVVALAGHAAVCLDNAHLFKQSKDELAARKLAETRLRFLIDELNHRVKNTLAIVQSISGQTARSAPSPDCFHRAFEGRLVALSEAHNILSQRQWDNASLQQLIDRQIDPVIGGDRTRIAVRGPDVLLSPGATVSLGIILHELVTNAVRHGALSTQKGCVEITVEYDDDGRTLRIIWQELGSVSVDPPRRRGFGLRAVERTAKHDLRGEAVFTFGPPGVSCVVTANLPSEPGAQNDSEQC